jgi:tetratricopeptide (TPR) repeat protein
VIVVAGWFAYAPALGAIFLLDDVSNLNGLRLVEDAVSAFNFIFSGTSGPTGRPLALATFVSQAADWGQQAAPFLRANIVIHLANATILAFLLYRLAVLSQVREGNALLAAVSAAALWVFLPLLASSSLMIVQRMTTLSAFFVLVGLAGYLTARQSIDRRPVMAMTWMSVSVVLGTVLAVLSKENGALLPTFVLVMESTLLIRPTTVKLSHWRAWTGAVLWLPTLCVLVYLALCVPYSPELVLRRDFSGWERLLTQSRILWEYLFNAFVPQPGKFGPFHDGYPVARTIWQPVTLLASLAWLITVSLALAWRRRFPLLSFGVLWYVGGHLLESTLVSLELYFEHRNYLPIIGPIFALCMFAAKVQATQKRLVYAGLSAYIFLNAVMLWSQASLWGNPQMAVLYWQGHFPDSVRAATTVATYQLDKEGPRSALQTLKRIVEEDPESAYLKIQELNISCIILPGSDHGKTVSELRSLLPGVDFTYSAGTMFSDLITTISNSGCEGVDIDVVRELADTLAGNPRYANDVQYKQLHQQLLARLSRHEGDFDETLRHLEKAIDYKPSSELNMMMVTTLADAGNFADARTYIDNARDRLPANPFRRSVWQNQLDELSRYIYELEKHRAAGAASQQ